MKNSFFPGFALLSLCLLQHERFVRSEVLQNRVENFGRDTLARFSEKSVRNVDSRIREVRMGDERRVLSASREQSRVRFVRDLPLQEERVTLMTRRVTQNRFSRPEPSRTTRMFREEGNRMSRSMSQDRMVRMENQADRRIQSRRAQSLDRFEATERRMVQESREMERREVRSEPTTERRIAERRSIVNAERRLIRVRNDNRRVEDRRESRLSRRVVRDEETRVQDSNRRLTRNENRVQKESRRREEGARVRESARDERQRMVRGENRQMIRGESIRMVRADESRRIVREESSRRVVRETSDGRRMDTRRILSTAPILEKRIIREVRDTRISDKDIDNNRMAREYRQERRADQQNFGKSFLVNDLSSSPNSDFSWTNQLTSALFGGAAIFMMYTQSKKQKVE